ncbi:MAG: ATP-binding protein [Patescibacteria group bacterium]|nr:ATP-binding protein [Patescibacteria group bacterium]
MKIGKIPFYRKIIFKIFILVCVVLFGALGINLLLTNQMIEKRMEHRLLNDFDSAYHTTENFINLISQTSQMWAKEIVASHLDFKNTKKEKLNNLLKIEKDKMSADSIILVDNKGMVLAQNGSKHIVGDSLKYRDIIKQTLKTKTQVTNIAREKETFIIYSSAVIEEKDDLVGILLVGYFINDSFLENIKKNTNLELAFIGNSAVMSSTKWGTTKNLDILPISYLKYQNLLNDPKEIKEISYRDKTYMVSARKLNNIESLVSGSILFAYPYDKIIEAKEKLIDKKLMVFYFTIFISLTLIYLVIKKHLNAFDKLTKSMNDISKNKIYKNITIDTKDEIELLTNSFNDMGNELNILHINMQTEIENKTKELKELNDGLEQKIKLEVEKNRKKDQQMVEQSRLAQMGEMISMIAHQWRQPLAAISSTSAGINLKAKLNKLDKETAIELSTKIGSYSQHLSTTIDDFREFFKSNKEKSKMSYDEIIQSVMNIVEISIANKNIKIIKDLQCKSQFNSYPNEIKQVVLNLIKNAEDVLIEKDIQNPTITIKTKDNILYISDNGGGIPEDIMPKIFDPYFSTKTKKDGTGLGLYMSKTIIEEHCGGELSVSNDKVINKDGKPSCGAVFKIKLGDTNV